MRLFWIAILCFSIPFLGYGQGENDNWIFGYNSGLNVSNNEPSFFETTMYSREGTAAISDAFGNLIFYSNGSTVWDKNGNAMPNGNILGNASGGSGTQAVLILKSLSNPNQYYIFTLDPEELALVGFSQKLRYSIVDMSLNNGLGDVHPTLRNIVLDDEMEERMVAVESDDCGYWIVSHKRRSKYYVSFKLTENGISGPFYSLGSTRGYFISDVGEIKISPDRSKIAINFTNLDSTFEYNTSYFGLELANFNPSTGMVSDAILIDSANGTRGYGLSFSPDSKKLYAFHDSYEMDLHQYDISSFPNANAIINSKISVFHCDSSDINRMMYGMRLSDDGKIYLASNAGYISIIEAPNENGINCNANLDGIPVPVTNYFPAADPFYGYGLGNPTVSIRYVDTLPGKNGNITVCFSDSLILRVDNNLLSYNWDNGETGFERTVYTDGSYYCISTQQCAIRIDTFHVSFVKGSAQLGNDTTICPTDSIVLRADVPDAHFKWQDGSTDSVYVVTAPGTYRITIDEKGCYYSDTVVVGMYEGKVHITPHDTMICKGDAITLEGRSDPVGSFTWNTGARSSYLEVSEPGEYILQADGVCGPLTDTARVLVQDCNCRPQLPNAFTPNGDGRNDRFGFILDCVPEGLQLRIYNRMGESVFVSFSSENKWDGTFHGKPCDIGTYYYILKYRTPNGEDKLYKGDLTLLR